MNLKKKLDEAKIRQAAYFQGKQDAESELLPKIERLSAKTEIDQITMDNFLGQLKQKDAEISRLSSENERLKSQLDEFVYVEDNPTYESEAERLQKIIVKAYQHLGFTSAKNQTMRILGTGLPNRKDSEHKERVSTEQTPVCPETAMDKDCTQNGNKDTNCRHLGDTRTEGGMTYCDDCGVELL